MQSSIFDTCLNEAQSAHAAQGSFSALRLKLREFLEPFSNEFERPERLAAGVLYLEGLLLGGRCRSAQIFAQKIKANLRAIDHFVNHSPWDHEAITATYCRNLYKRGKRRISAVVLDELIVSRYGRHAIGASRHLEDWTGIYRNSRRPDGPPRSSVGQLVHLWNWAERDQFLPIAAQLFLPTEWTGNRERMLRADVPTHAQRQQNRWEAALDLLHRHEKKLPPFDAVVCDIHYGYSLQFIAALEQKGIPYVVEIPPHGGKPLVPTRFYPLPSDNGSRRRAWRGKGFAYCDWISRLEREMERWMPLELADADRRRKYYFADYLEMIPLVEEFRRYCRPRWLIILRKNYSSFHWRFFISNLSPETHPSDVAELAHLLDSTQQYQRRINSRLGARYFEGRSWRGLHHHVAMCLLAGEFMKRYSLI